jgi:hypothetical protein
MSFITIVPVAPLRAEPSHKSEMTSQLLFGELCDVIELTKNFLKVRCRYDGYEGWCQRGQLTDYGLNDYTDSIGFVGQWSSEVLLNGSSCIVPHASVVEQREMPEFEIGPYKIMHLSPPTHLPRENDDKSSLIKAFADRYLGVGYLWGGKSVFGVDCSGFVQQVFKMTGIWLPRDSSQQAELGEAISFLQEAKAGDLAFFDNEEGRIVHVGIMLNDHEIIHASGNVHIDNIDSAGIMHHITGIRTHKLRIIKRLF